MSEIKSKTDVFVTREFRKDGKLVQMERIFYSIPEAAKLLGVSRQWMHNMVARGIVKAFAGVMSTNKMIHVDELKRYKEFRERNPHGIKG